MGTTTRDLMLRLTPEVYLARGYLDASGSLRRLLKGEVATAAAMQLMQAELSPQEFGLTVEGLRQLLPLHDEPTAPERLHATLQEAVEVVARIIQQPNNGGLVQWISACATASSAGFNRFAQPRSSARVTVRSGSDEVTFDLAAIGMRMS